MVKVMYNDKLVYKVVIWGFWGYFMKREGSFKQQNQIKNVKNTAFWSMIHGVDHLRWLSLTAK